MRQDSLNQAQLQYVPTPSFGASTSRDYPTEYPQSSAKRQRTSVSNGSASYERDTTYGQRPYIQTQGSFGIYTPHNQTLANNAPDYAQAPLSASAAMPEFTFRYPLPETSSAPSPFVSPRSQVPNYSPAAQQQMMYQQQQQQPRYGSQNFPQAQYTDLHSTTMPRLVQPVPVNRHSNPAEQLQINTTNPYSANANQDSRASMSSGGQRRTSAVRDDYFQYSQQTQSPDQAMRAPQVPQNRYGMSSTTQSNLLPPLHSTVGNAQPLLATAPTYNPYVPPDNRLPSQPIPQRNLLTSQDRYTVYPHGNVDLDDRRDLQEHS